MVNKHIKRYSTLIIREMQSKTTMRYHFTLVKTAIIKKTKIASIDKDVKKREPCALLVGMWIGAYLIENSMEVPKKLKIELPYIIYQFQFWVFSQRRWKLIQKAVCIPMFTAAFFTIAKIWKQPRCPQTDEWIKKLCYIYIMEYYSII